MKKINSVLIANRGEIAIRIAKTLAEMSIKTFGIYADDGCYVALTNCDFCYVVGTF